jgi:type IV pilus assembly protein PilA
VTIAVTLANTGNAALNGTWFGLLGVGNADGTVTWDCTTLTAANGTARGGVTAMYPFLPTNCQH